VKDPFRDDSANVETARLQQDEIERRAARARLTKSAQNVAKGVGLVISVVVIVVVAALVFLIVYAVKAYFRGMSVG
jgi:hypothetical protein